jgi:ribosome maturation factor RimP
MFDEDDEVIGKKVERIDHFDRYFAEVVKINLSTGPTITGKLVEIDEIWIVVQKNDGDEVSIRKKGVYAIGMVKPRYSDGEDFRAD